MNGWGRTATRGPIRLRSGREPARLGALERRPHARLAVPASAARPFRVLGGALFEEVGVLLCVNESGEDVDLYNKETKQRIEFKRQAIVKNQLGFGAFLAAENLYCDLSRAVYFDHWVTPEIYSMRFDTRFYIAELPPHQVPLARSEEVTHSLWLKPEEALARLHRTDFPILPPTTTVLHELARLGSWERLCREFNLP